jgi:two-component system, OmpR family, sensor histidine kinase KdpD
MSRGNLRIYLGAAPGVGKTYAMLAEGQRRRSRGTDVVGALIETHGRRLTSAMTEGLEIVPLRTMTYRGATFTEMDTDAVLARHPQVALVDELAHSNVPGCRNAKRWQDVDELLEAGIDVVTTLNIQHLESLSAVAEQVSGVRQQETLPDAVARRADQIELVDMTPEALRRRMAHGNVYPPNRIEAALTHYFRPGNLTALRELALLWLAGRVEEGLQRYRAEHGIAVPWETTERIVVAIAGEKDDEAVIRRAARIAARSPGSDLVAVHVTSDDGLRSGPEGSLDQQRSLVVSVGGSVREIPGDDIPGALLRFARAENATQMVLGASRRGRLLTLLVGKSIPTRVARQAGHIDVHLVSRDDQDRLRPALAGALAPLRSRRVRAARAGAEAAALTRLATSVLRGRGDTPALLEELRQMFGLDAVSLLELRGNGPGPSCYVAASAGEHPPEGPGADVELPVSDTFTLAARGHAPSKQDLPGLLSCASLIVTGLSYQRQEERDAQAARRAANLRSREALLAATGESARVQLAVATAALTELAEGGAELTAEDRAARLDDARRAVGRLSLVVADLRDLGRLHAGAVETYLRPVDLDEVLAAALEDLGPGGQHVTLSTAEDLPDVIADGALLTRMLTSLVADAVTRNPAGPPPAIVADARGGQVELRITDHGPGQDDGGASLAFRLARDLADAMGDTVRSEQVPGNGRTVTITLPAAAPRSCPAPGDLDLAAQSSLFDAERTVVPAAVNDDALASGRRRRSGRGTVSPRTCRA